MIKRDLLRVKETWGERELGPHAELENATTKP
jgi:hypothetical protein